LVPQTPGDDLLQRLDELLAHAAFVEVAPARDCVVDLAQGRGKQKLPDETEERRIGRNPEYSGVVRKVASYCRLTRRATALGDIANLQFML
jgi:hypothetical protein